jgi:hypothetical protein
VRQDVRIRGLLDTDRSVRRFFEGDTLTVPPDYAERVRRDLGPLWDWLPPGGLEHDPNAYLKSLAPAPRDASSLAYPAERPNVLDPSPADREVPLPSLGRDAPLAR